MRDDNPSSGPGSRAGDGASTMRIGEFAAAAEVGVQTIRYYERCGLLRDPPRTTGGFRLYSDDDLLRLRFIRRAQSFGFALREIQVLLGVFERPDDDARRRIAEAVQARLEASEHQLDGLNVAIEVCRRVLDAHDSNPSMIDRILLDEIMGNGDGAE